ncbi:MAG: hypothetical protein EOL87_02660 [Spartobacteria bacterium]|nr:hypothetical protein [Spartobacteria bacterium]
MSIYKTIRAHHEMLSNLIGRELKSKYKGSALGFLWSVLTPLFMAFVYVFFLRLLARGVPMESIIIGVFAWQFTAQSVNEGLFSITGNANLVKKVFFPREILPTASVFSNMINYLLSLVVQFLLLGVMLGMQGMFFSWTIIFVPVIIIYHVMFLLSLAYLLSAANVYFRDAQHLVGVLLSAWFFSSPAMYDLTMVEAVATKYPIVMQLYMLNPMASIITAYRAAILPGVGFPFTSSVVVGLTIPFILFFVSQKVFQRAQRNFADLL